MTALLAIAVSLGVGRLRTASSQPAIEQALTRLQQWDARERWRARLQGGRSWRLQRDGAVLPESMAAGTEPSLVLPDGVQCRWQDQAGAVLEELHYSQQGCSAEVQLELRQDGDTRRYRILGISGQWLAE